MLRTLPKPIYLALAMLFLVSLACQTVSFSAETPPPPAAIQVETAAPPAALRERPPRSPQPSRPGSAALPPTGPGSCRDCLIVS